MTDEILSADHQLPQNPVLPDNLVALEVHERQGLSGVSVNLVDCVDDAMKLMSWLGERRPVMAVDTETTGLNAWAGNLRLVQIGDAMTGWAIPWGLWGGVFIEAMKKYQGEIAFHNAAFDARWLTVHTPWEVPWHRTHDTMIMAHVIDPTQAVGLKPLSNRFVDRRASAGEHLLKEAFATNKWSWDTVPIDFGPYWEYGALDTVLTARLWELFRADKRYPRVYDLEMAVRRISSRMEDRGAPVDLEYCNEQYEKFSRYVESAKKWWKETFDISVGSAAKLVEFFQGQGAEITRTTPKGAPSMDKYQLRLLAGQDYALAQNVLDIRKAQKLADTYFLNFINKSVDGVLHPSIRTLGARTGRMSITDPALQTLPKGEATVRRAFVPREGESLISVDYAQVEMRLMAHFSKDEALAAAFRNADATGGDFFVELGKQIYRDPNFTKNDKRRGLVKNTLYGVAYGAGVAKQAETAGVPFDVMKEVSDAVYSNYPGIRRFQQEIEQEGFRTEREEGIGYVLTPFGRRLPADSGRLYTLVNYALQGHAAELLKDAMVRLDAAGLGENLILPVHDEIIASVPTEDAEEAKRLIVETMQVLDGYAVPLLADGEGPLVSWGDKYAS